MSTAALQGLLEYLYVTLSPDNMLWVANHLIEQAKQADDSKLKPYTMEEINAMLDEAEANYAAGKGIPDEEVMREWDEEIACKEDERLKPYTMEEIDAMLDEAEAAFDAGDYLTNEEVFHHHKEAIAV